MNQIKINGEEDNFQDETKYFKKIHLNFLHPVKNSIQSRGDEEGQERGEAQSEDDGGCHTSKNYVEEQRNHA